MEEIDLKEMFDYFKAKFMWVIITLIFVVVAGNVFTILTRVPMYKSSTTIVLVNDNGTGGYNQTEQQLNKNLVSTYAEIIKSRKVLKQVISNLDLNCTAVELSNNITVESVENTEVIKISVGYDDSDKAAQIADEIASVFSAEIRQIYKLNNISIIDKAEKSVSPYNINYLKDNVIYAAIAIVLSCGFIFIMFYFDTTVKTSEEIEKKLGLTVLGVVPKTERK